MPLLLDGPLTLQCHLVGAMSLAFRVQFWGTTGGKRLLRHEVNSVIPGVLFSACWLAIPTGCIFTVKKLLGACAWASTGLQALCSKGRLGSPILGKKGLA